MKLKLYSILWLLMIFIINSCDLEKIEPGSGNQTKFETNAGGNGNDFANDIITTSDGGYIVAGCSQCFTSGVDGQAYLVKLNAQGTIIWEATFEGSGDSDAASVVQTSDGDYIFGGSFSLNTSPLTDIYIVKVNKQGNKIWEKSYGLDNVNEYASSIVQIGASDFLIVYNVHGGGINTSINLLRISTNGSIISEKEVRTGEYIAHKMIKLSDGNIIIIGTLLVNGNTMDSYILKLDENGSFIWEKQFPVTGNNSFLVRGVTELSNKDLVLAGYNSGSTQWDFKLVSINQIGGNNWEESWGGASGDILFSVDKTNENQLVVMGVTESFTGKSEIYLSKRIVTDGSKLWEKNFIEINPFFGNIVESTPDGGFIIVSSVINASNANYADIIIVKTDSDGNYK